MGDFDFPELGGARGFGLIGVVGGGSMVGSSVIILAGIATGPPGWAALAAGGVGAAGLCLGVDQIQTGIVQIYEDQPVNTAFNGCILQGALGLSPEQAGWTELGTGIFFAGAQVKCAGSLSSVSGCFRAETAVAESSAAACTGNAVSAASAEAARKQAIAELMELLRRRMLGTPPNKPYNQLEQRCGEALERRIGRLERCTDEVLGDWTRNGKFYEGIGPVPPEFTWEEFSRAFNKHCTKSCDGLAVHTGGLSADEISRLHQLVEQNRAAGTLRCKEVYWLTD